MYLLAACAHSRRLKQNAALRRRPPAEAAAIWRAAQSDDGGTISYEDARRGIISITAAIDYDISKLLLDR